MTCGCASTSPIPSSPPIISASISVRASRSSAHIPPICHFGDAKGLDGEGLQIGEGEIDFDQIGGILRKHAPDASFIPEIWQGHKNMGEGFWTALERLEGRI